MTDQQMKLLSLLANVLFEKPTNVQISPDILSEAKSQTVTAIISSDFKTISQNIRVINAHAQLTPLLMGIPFVTFKGYASSYYYPLPEKRHMGDVDFIVESSDYDKVIAKLLANGFEECHADHERHRSFKKDKIEYELHSEIKGVPNGLDGIPTTSTIVEERVRKHLSTLICSAHVVKTQQGDILIPDEFHHGLIMLLHVAGHMITGGGVGLRHLCDWAVFVSKVNLKQYKDEYESIGVWTFACQLTAVSIKYLGLPKQEWCGEWPVSFLEQLIEEILSAGNFGRKEAGRTAAMTLERESFSKMTRKRYPQANKLTLPVYMMANLIRYTKLVIKGKKQVIKPSTVLGAKNRKKLYQQFHLFEI